MSNAMQRAVSRNKRRYKDKDFDLDLSYITKRIVAMGFPSEKREALYRNPMSEVFKFFEKKHENNYYIYNLCAEKERIYDPSKFHGRVKHFPFYDHNAPPINIIDECCKDMKQWLEDPEHMVGIHCKAGKGRTGLIICCYLLFSGICSTSEEALTYYGNKRTKDGKGVTIASQKRYIKYYERVLFDMDGVIPPIQPLIMTRIRISDYPKKEIVGDPFINIIMDDKVAHKTSIGSISKINKKGYKADVPVNGRIIGDCKIQVLIKKRGGGKQKLCHFWFNSAFVVDNKLVLTKSEIDVANKDKKCKIFKEDFLIEIFFKSCDDEEIKNKNINNSIEDKTIQINSNESNDNKPQNTKSKIMRKSFYDYSDYGNLQQQLELSQDEDSDD
jgi:phosphatidylinositol-3,4,5-trisphosphate 3-phosphatase/dual-specificity protein phosphatase PTEN